MAVGFLERARWLSWSRGHARSYLHHLLCPDGPCFPPMSAVRAVSGSCPLGSLPVGRESTTPGTAALPGPTAPSGRDLRDRLAGYMKPGKATKGFPRFQKPHLDRPAILKCLWVNIPESSSRLWEGPPRKWAGNGRGDSAARSRQGQRPPCWLPAQGPRDVSRAHPKSCRPAVCTSQVCWAGFVPFQEASPTVLEEQSEAWAGACPPKVTRWKLAASRSRHRDVRPTTPARALPAWPCKQWSWDHSLGWGTGRSPPPRAATSENLQGPNKPPQASRRSLSCLLA